MTDSSQAPVQGPQDSIVPGSAEDFAQYAEQSGLLDEQPDEQERAPEAPDPQQAAEAEQAEQTEQQAPEAPEYESFDDYLTKAKLDRDSFLQLPVTVKVDGEDRRVSLNELLKGHELSQAGHERMRQVAEARTAFESEQKQVREALGLRIQQTEALFKQAEQQLLAEYQTVNWQQLQQENPGQAALLFQHYQARQQAIKDSLNQIQATRQQEEQKAAQERQKAFPAEWAKLLAVYPEMGDATKGTEARARISAYAQKAGISQADIATLLSPQGFDAARVRTLLDAAAWADLQAKKPATVNRVRTAPQMAKPGARQVRDPKAVATQKLDEAWAKSGYRDDDIAAQIFARF